jgi:hypothetical protein
VHSVIPDSAGTFSDVGYVRTFTTDPYYYSEDLRVAVRDVQSYLIVGRGTAFCVYIAQSTG